MAIDTLRHASPFLVAVLIGATLGAGLGYFGQCNSGTCPLTSTWWRGAIYGGLMGLLFASTSNAGSSRSRPDAASASALTQVANKGQSAQAAPAWALPDLNGRTVTLSSLKGKVVLLNFWATWCPPCRTEIPDLIALQKKYADDGVVVVGVSLDETGSSAVKSFVAKNGINYPVVMGDQRTASAYGGITAIPTTFVIDRGGKVVGEIQGGADLAGFEAAIKPAL